MKPGTREYGKAYRSIILTVKLSYCRAASSWLKVAPWGLRRLMQFIKSHYGEIPVYITENGFSDAQGNLDDMQREYYYKHNINQLLKGNYLNDRRPYSIITI